MDKQQREAQREAVKTLAIAVGVREAARRLKLNENTVISWSKRDNWQIKSPKPPGQARNQSAIAPSDALVATLKERKESSQLNLSKYQERATAEAADHPQPLAITGKAKDLAGIHQAIWPEKEQTGSGVFPGLAVYSKQTILQVHQKE